MAALAMLVGWLIVIVNAWLVFPVVLVAIRLMDERP